MLELYNLNFLWKHLIYVLNYKFYEYTRGHNLGTLNEQKKNFQVNLIKNIMLKTLSR